MKTAGSVHKGEHFLALIADGMGGHKAGDVASSKTIQLFEKAWNSISEDEIETPVKAEEWLLKTVTNTNLELFQYANSNADCNGMGTTLVGTLCTPSYLTILHIGDSRVYYFSENKLIQKTEDHTLVNELVRSGQLSKRKQKTIPEKTSSSGHWEPTMSLRWISRPFHGAKATLCFYVRTDYRIKYPGI